MQDREDFYVNLRSKLEETTIFPARYLYKFIVPTTENQVQEVKDLFKGVKAMISTKESKTAKFISVSINLMVSSSDSVIDYYKRAEKIEGIISL